MLRLALAPSARLVEGTVEMPGEASIPIGQNNLENLPLLTCRTLLDGGYLRVQAWDADKLLAELRTLGPGLTYPLPQLEKSSYHLSRFAHLRQDHGFWVLEGYSAVQIRLLDPRLLNQLTEPGPVAPLLLAAGFLVREGEEDELATWEFHDLVFHARSRQGRNVDSFGFSGRHVGVSPPLPAVRPLPEGPYLQLPTPREFRDASFQQVLSQRSSQRVFGSEPMSLDQLSEFLERVGRMRGLSMLKLAVGQVAVDYPASSRPYPGGGSIYELEIYPFVNRVAGLERGVYHYDPQGHGLTRLPGSPDKILAWAGSDWPDVFLVISARFGRITWKYDSLAYALILKNVGVLLQTMYLVATAMGLAGCAIGSGNPDDFCEATGNSYLHEGSVGEFTLGSQR